MKWIMTLALICLVSACQSPKDALIGEWKVDREALEQTLIELKVPPPAGTIAIDLSEPIGEWRLAFHANRELIMNVNGVQSRGRYQVSRAVSNTVYIRAEVKPVFQSEIDHKLEVKRPKSEVKTHRLSMRISGDQATLSLDNMRPMKMRRSATSLTP